MKRPFLNTHRPIQIIRLWSLELAESVKEDLLVKICKNNLIIFLALAVLCLTASCETPNLESSEISYALTQSEQQIEKNIIYIDSDEGQSTKLPHTDDIILYIYLTNIPKFAIVKSPLFSMIFVLRVADNSLRIHWVTNTATNNTPLLYFGRGVLFSTALISSCTSVCT